jgi:hypothetical protein
MTSDSRRSGNNASQATLLGPPSVLIVRLQGEVYPIETTKSVIQRNPALDVLSEFVVPESPVFIPPVGQKYFDPTYIESQRALRSKGKVNLSLIRDRDAELRGITEVVADALFRDILNATHTREYTRATLAGINDRAVEIPGSSHGKTLLAGNAATVDANKLCDNVSYGLYFHEILPRPPLLERLVVELRHCGVLSPPVLPAFATTSNQAVEGGDEEVVPYSPTLELPLASVHNPLPQLASPGTAEAPVQMQWVTAGDAVLAADASEVSIPLCDATQVFAALGIWEGSADPAMQDAYEALSSW